jgi:hypothetical protein
MCSHASLSRAVYFRLPSCKNSSASSPALAFVQRGTKSYLAEVVLCEYQYAFESMHVSVEDAPSE